MSRFRILLIISLSLFQQMPGYGQSGPRLTTATAAKLSRLPLHCIGTEFPNKTSHVANTAVDARLLPSELHPAFYGCLDWHSSVHGHWMLVRLLRLFPNLPNKDSIIAVLNNTFTVEKMKAEADYFTKYDVANTYERTYGWAWLLKLDQELSTWNNPDAARWYKALQPLTQEILRLWKLYLPKQVYPNRTGVHPNTAFGLAFALDWARQNKDADFEHMIIDRAKFFYLDNKNTPAYLEPDGSDFFSPSLEIADLMWRVLPQKEFTSWLTKFYQPVSIQRISKIPVITDMNDYMGVHLVGLSFSRAWCLKGIAKALPKGHKWKAYFETTANKFLNNALPLLSASNYGGDHWLATFAVLALDQ